MNIWNRINLRLLLLLAVSLGLAPIAEAKESFYKQGLQHYAKGEFDKAIQDLQKALTRKPSKVEKIKIYKYVGLSHYTLGRQAEAERNFEQCLATDSGCSIDKREALDESVLPFFRDVKKRMAARKNAPKAKTKILVKSSVKDAEILMDGILLGSVNTSLDARSGTREIIIKAKGYRPRRVKIAVNKLVENVYEVELDKLPSKAEKIEKPGKGEKLAKRDRPRRPEVRKAREDKKDKMPLVLPNEDETAETLLDPGVDSEKRDRKENLELVEDRGPPPSKPAPPADAPTPTPTELTKTPVSFAHFLPLGIGQFYNGDYLLGTLFLGSQLYAAGVIVVANQDIQQAQQNANAIRQAETDPNVTQDDLDAFTVANNNFVKEKQERINLALGVAAGTYIFGVLHAVIMRPYDLSAKGTTVAEIPSPAAVNFHLQPTGDLGLKMELNWSF